MRKLGMVIVVLMSSIVSQGWAATSAATNGAIMVAVTKKSCPMKVSKAMSDAGIANFAKDQGLPPKSAAQLLDKVASQVTARLRKEGKLKAFCARTESILKARTK